MLLNVSMAKSWRSKFFTLHAPPSTYNKEVARTQHVAHRHIDILLLHQLGDLHEALRRLLHAVRKEIVLRCEVIELAALLLVALLRLLDRQLRMTYEEKNARERTSRTLWPRSASPQSTHHKSLTEPTSRSIPALFS